MHWTSKISISRSSFATKRQSRLTKGSLAGRCALLPGILLLAILQTADAEEHFPKITLPWEYEGIQQDRSARMLNRIGDAVASLDYHPHEDLWILSLTHQTGETYFSRIEGVSVHVLGKGTFSLESARDCADCIAKQGDSSSMHVPLAAGELELIRQGFFLDFHYRKAGLRDEENGFIFRVGLIDAGRIIDRIRNDYPGPVGLDAIEFTKGVIWILRENDTVRDVVLAREETGWLLVKQKENENWYSRMLYAISQDPPGDANGRKGIER